MARNSHEYKVQCPIPSYDFSKVEFSNVSCIRFKQKGVLELFNTCTYQSRDRISLNVSERSVFPGSISAYVYSSACACNIRYSLNADDLLVYMIANMYTFLYNDNFD
jgi:hypothetical protein